MALSPADSPERARTPTVQCALQAQAVSGALLFIWNLRVSDIALQKWISALSSETTRNNFEMLQNRHDDVSASSCKISS